MGMQSQDPQHALKELAGRIKKLSYGDMKCFVGMFPDVFDPEELPDHLIGVADQILGPDYNPNAPTTRAQ